MRVRIAALVAFLFAAVSLVAVASPAHARADKNCSDFDNQAQAQKFFEDNGGGPNNNVDGLDADGDGVVCETLPCPCSNGGGGGGGGGGTAAKPPHKLTAKGREIGNTDRFVVTGKVTTFKGHRIRVQRKVGAGPYKAYKSTKTRPRTGYYKTGIKQAGNKRTCFKVVVPATKKYRLTSKRIGCITTR